MSLPGLESLLSVAVYVTLFLLWVCHPPLLHLLLQQQLSGSWWVQVLAAGQGQQEPFCTLKRPGVMFGNIHWVLFLVVVLPTHAGICD